MNRADLERGRAAEPLVRVSGVHHVALDCPDLDAAERFYRDFGLVLSARTEGAVYMRARGVSHHVLKLARGPRGRLASVALSVDSELDMRKLASLPGATLAPRDEPGGGSRVRLVAPGGGIVFEAVHGMEEVAPLPSRGAVPSNITSAIARAGRPVRLPPAPSEVLRVGHAALETPEPRELILWLMRTLGMIVSDYQPLDDAPGAAPIASFLRCDRGATATDHHTLAIALGPRAGLAHVAFEVRDIDEIGRGAAHLRKHGYQHAWGIGRHILGSQLFDYWRAPDGVIAEHYCDGDVFDAQAPTGSIPFCGSNLAQWGGPPPRDFALPPFTPRDAIETVRGIATSNNLPLMAKALLALSR